VPTAIRPKSRRGGHSLVRSVSQHSFHLAASQAAVDFVHAAAESPAQQRSQSHAFDIADFGGDLVDAGMAGPEKVHRALYPQVLEQGERRLPQHALLWPIPWRATFNAPWPHTPTATSRS
jgi:hypothetical protein